MIEIYCESIIINTLALGCLWYLYFFLYKQCVVDYFRQNMFERRDSLFDEVADGLTSFDHPAYGTLRRTMNGYIRFAHQLDLGKILVTRLMASYNPALKEDIKEFQAQIDGATAGLPPDVRIKIEEYRKKMHLQMAKHIFFASPIMCIMILSFALPVSFVFCLTGSLKRNIHNNINRLESTALASGY